MPFIRHKQRAITSVSPVRGQGRWINPSKGRRGLTYDQLVERAQQIKDNAGVPAGITPGPTSTPGTITQPTISIPTASSAALITTEGITDATPDSARFWSAESNGGTSVGTGTQADPYQINSLRWNDQGATATPPNAYHFKWDDPAATYYIKMTDCGWRDSVNTVTGAGQIQIETGTALEMVSCNVYKSGGASVPHIFLGNGDLTVKQVSFTGQTDSVLTKGAPSAVLFTDCIYDNSDATWQSGVAGVFHNTAPGGSITERRCQFTFTAGIGNIQYYVFTNDCAIVMDSCLVSSQANADLDQGLLVLVSTTPSFSLVNLLLPKTWVNSAIYGGSNQIFAAGAPNSFALSHATIEHCDLYHHSVGTRLMDIGRSGPTGAEPAVDLPEDVKILSCKLEKTNDGTFANGQPGNEALEIIGAKDCEMAFNYMVGCPEDAFEFHTPRSGNSIHDCVLGAVRNQGADIFHDSDPSIIGFNTSGSRIYNIFGSSGADAAVFTNIHNSSWENVLVDNSANIGGLPDTPAIANVWLSARNAGTPTNITGSGFITQASQSRVVPYVDEGTNNTNTSEEAPAIIPT